MINEAAFRLEYSKVNAIVTYPIFVLFMSFQSFSSLCSLYIDDVYIAVGTTIRMVANVYLCIFGRLSSRCTKRGLQGEEFTFSESLGTACRQAKDPETRDGRTTW